MIVRLTEEAEGDLERIADYIAQDNPHRALSFILELRDRCMSLASMHSMFPYAPRYERYGIRQRIYENYRIFYRIRAEQVVIICSDAQ
jgi:toxin ParE1/3/4